MPRKTRTREHIIADYSGVHFEKNALACGYSVERTLHDYGIDMTLYTYDSNGALENDAILIQLKATDNLKVLRGEQKISLPLEWADLEKWKNDSLLVVLILYDAQREIAYWIDIQRYLEIEKVAPEPGQKTLNIHFDVADVLDSGAMRKFAEWKNQINQRNKRRFD